MTELARDYLRRLEIQHFGCIEGSTLQLTPLHALIGPNDSGKSTILGLLNDVADVSQGAACATWRSRRVGRTRVVLDDLDSSGEIRCGSWFRPNSEPRPALVAEAWVDGHRGPGTPFAELSGDLNLCPAHALVGLRERVRLRRAGSRFLSSLQGGAYLLRLDPDAMRVPAQLIESSARLATWSPRGQGLAAIFDAVFTRDFGRIVQLNAEFAALFPSVKQLTLENTGDQRKRLGVVLQNGTSVSAEQISEGMLYWLAFKALEFLEPAGLILVEEPENGLHPARIREVMKVLRDLSTRSQVILATHSPLVINELEGDEVTVLTRDPVRGTQATRLCDTPNYEERSRVYQNGELWLAYSDGDSEAALLDSKVVD